MIIEKETVVVENSEELLTGEFGIDEEDMGFVLGLLRNKIYSDPIGSIAREILSNCRDANREVGQGHIPPVVRVSSKDEWLNSSSLSISFEDNGPGISPERMYKVFLRYGKSTKKDDNTQTGGFGMGCKTPFAYTDAFTIITKVDGVKYFYSAVIDESLKGKIVCLHKEHTADGNGTIIAIPIKDQDRYSFEEGVIKASVFWEVRPVLTNFQHQRYPEISKTFENDTFYICEKLYHSNALLTIDGVMYPVKDSPDTCGYTTVYKFPNGVLNLSVNRETVQYDDKTNALLKASYKNFYETIFEKILSVVNEDNVHINQIKRCSAIANPYGDNSFNSQIKTFIFYHEFLKRAPGQIIAPLHELKCWKDADKLKRLSRIICPYIHRATDKDLIYFYDVKTPGKVRAVLSSWYSVKEKQVKMPRFNEEKAKEAPEAYKADYEERLGLYNEYLEKQAEELEFVKSIYTFTLVSTLTPVKGPTVVKNEVVKISAHRFKSKFDFYDDKTSSIKFDYNKNTKVVLLSEEEIKSTYLIYVDSLREYQLKKPVTTLYRAIAIEKDLSILIVNKKAKKQLTSFKEVDQILVDFKDETQKMINFNTLQDIDVIDHVNGIDWQDNNVEKALKLKGKDYSTKLTKRSFLDTGDIKLLMDEFCLSIDQTTSDTVNKINTLFDKYPMLALIKDTHYFGKSELEIINKYIKDNQ